ncbi:MAG: hypothetical protein IKT30_07000 [Bacteroidaceae bacterium]|nr:hypothetical protein [Bacteroidaceae bacterium]
MNHGQADSAFRMLCGMNAEAESMPQSLQMRHLLLRSNAQNKANVLFTSDSIGNVLVSYYDRHGSPNERMLAHYIKGCAYRDMDDLSATLDCYNNAVFAAVPSSPDCNYDQLGIIYKQIAAIFHKRLMSDEAIQAYELAERYSLKAKDTVNILTIWDGKSNSLLKEGYIWEALFIKEEVARKFREMNCPQNAAQIMGLCVKWYARQGEFDKAKAAMEEYETHSGYFLENGDIEPGREDYYHIKGVYYFQKEMLDSAHYYFRKLQKNAKTRNSQYLAAWGLTRFYNRYGKQDSVAKYALQTLKHLYKISTRQNQQNAQAVYNYSRYFETVHRKEVEAKDTQLRFFKWIVGSIATAFGLTLLILLQHLRNRKKTQTIEGLNGLIEGMNKVISQNATDLQLKEKLEESVSMLEKTLQAYRTKEKIHSRTHNLNTLQQQPVVKRMIEMGKARKEYPTSNDWHTLYPLVEEFYPEMARIRKKTSETEYQICVLTKLDCDLSDIIYLMGVSRAYMSTTRKRLSEKLFHTDEGSAKLFDQRIKEL